MPMDDLILERDSAWELMSPDERLLMAWMWRRILKVGRAKYGPLDVANDKREHIGEAMEECFDQSFYLFVELRKLELRRARLAEFIDEEPTNELADSETVIVDVGSGGVPNTWMAELGEPKIEIAVARTDSSEFPVMGMTACDDCAAPAGALHRSGCPYTVIVPASEVA